MIERINPFKIDTFGHDSQAVKIEVMAIVDDK